MPDLQKEIERLVNEKIRPIVNRDGGDVLFVDADEEQGIVRVRMAGACKGCPMAAITLQHGIERMVKNEFPFVKDVIAVEGP